MPSVALAQLADESATSGARQWDDQIRPWIGHLAIALRISDSQSALLCFALSHLRPKCCDLLYDHE